MLPKGGIPFIRPLPLKPRGQTDRKRIAVIGLGNVLFSDEGVGIHVAAELGRSCTFFPAIDIVDGGTLGLDLLPFFQDRDRVLILDACDFGKHPGHVAALAGDEIQSILNPKLSVHHIGLADLLLAAKLTRERPLNVCLVGIQPESLIIGLSLSDIVRQRSQEIIHMVLQKLAEWRVTALQLPSVG